MTTHAQTAKAIREELKKEFPNTAFSVRSSSFSMGDDVRIEWTNGPTTEQVEQITNKYEYGQFDGMIDLYEMTNVRHDIPQVKYIMTTRNIDKEIEEKTAQDIANRFGFDRNNPQDWFDKLGMWENQAVYKELRSVVL
jgi:glyceraldehyde-3-phosphate dehydrogenase/erythrose-4-phosphate dehydrogenase